MFAALAAAVALTLPGVQAECQPIEAIAAAVGPGPTAYAEPWNDRIVLSDHLCARPAEWFTIWTIGHELGHVALWRSGGDWQSEEAATCWGLAAVRRIARQLGQSPAAASALMRKVWRENAAWPTWNRWRCSDVRRLTWR